MRAWGKSDGRSGRAAAVVLARPVDAASLGVARIAVGAIGLLSAVRIVAYGWIDTLYAGPTHRFTYLGFGWVPQPGRGLMAALVGALALASAALVLGWRTRVATVTFLAAFAWIELIDVTTYLNHYWFVTLIAILGLVLPWGRALSLDARRTGGPTAVASGWVWLLRFQVGVVYASAGLAKLDVEWLAGRPLRLWLPARVDVPVLGGWLDEAAAPQVLALAGAAFDCAIVPLLLWRRTRLPAWLAVVAFHVVTWSLFPIGVFPWLMIAMATVFFEPEWPRRLAVRLGRSVAVVRRVQPPRMGRGQSALVAGVAIAWVVVQVALPLRHLAYPGDHRWNGQGYRFAWNVLFTERAGSVTFLVHEPASGRRWVADPALLYSRNQLRVMASEPDLIHQAALAIAAEQRRQGRDVEVVVDAWVSLNGRPPARLIDPDVDLAAQPRDPWSDPWILPAPIP